MREGAFSLLLFGKEDVRGGAEPQHGGAEEKEREREKEEVCFFFGRGREREIGARFELTNGGRGDSSRRRLFETTTRTATSIASIDGASRKRRLTTTTNNYFLENKKLFTDYDYREDDQTFYCRYKREKSCLFGGKCKKIERYRRQRKKERPSGGKKTNNAIRKRKKKNSFSVSQCFALFEAVKVKEIK